MSPEFWEFYAEGMALLLKALGVTLLLDALILGPLVWLIRRRQR